MTEQTEQPVDPHRGALATGTVPLAWYDPETYEDIKALMTDGRAFASSHDKWEGHAIQVEAFFVAKGVPTVRVPVNPRDFGRWCVSQGSAPDAKGRLAFSQWAAHARVITEPDT